MNNYKAPGINGTISPYEDRRRRQVKASAAAHDHGVSEATFKRFYYAGSYGWVGRAGRLFDYLVEDALTYREVTRPRDRIQYRINAGVAASDGLHRDGRRDPLTGRYVPRSACGIRLEHV